MQSNNFIFYKKIDSTQNEIWRLIESKTIKNKTLFKQMEKEHMVEFGIQTKKKI